MLVCILVTLITLVSTTKSASCPCKNTSLCDNIKTNYSKELYGFVGGGSGQINDTTIYNWTYTTAFAISDGDVKSLGSGINELMCTAHSNGVRMIYWNFPGMPFTDNTAIIMNWIKELFGNVTSLHFDGVTFDYEGSMLWNDPKMAQYVNVINMTRQYFYENLAGSTISVCVPFMAYLQWGRQYDYVSLAAVSDYLYIMGYDTNGQIWDGPCMARAVSPYMNIQRGVQSYLNLGIQPFKLILGVPWYGKLNLCVVDEMDGGPTGKFCPITPRDSKGVNCSNGAYREGHNSETPYAAVMNHIYGDKPSNITPIRWDNTQKTHFVNVNQTISKTVNLTQIWYDGPESLIYKYEYAKSMGLRGLGPFQFGDLIDSKSDDEKQRAQQMWAAFDTFFL